MEMIKQEGSHEAALQVAPRGAWSKGAWTFIEIPFSVEKIFGSKAQVKVAGTGYLGRDLGLVATLTLPCPPKSAQHPTAPPAVTAQVCPSPLEISVTPLDMRVTGVAN